MPHKPTNFLEKMKQQSKRWERLAALFVVGLLALNFPVMALFDKQVMVAGIPLLYVFLFVTWLLLIAASGWIIERRR